MQGEKQPQIIGSNGAAESLRPTDPFYVTGGTLPSNAPSYVVRAADTELFENIRLGEFCYVLNTRQMGKSSLMIRTANRLRAEGHAVVVLDLTAVGQNLTPEQWYDGLLSLLGAQLSPEIEDSLEDFWQDNVRLGPMQRFMEAMRNIVLPVIKTSYRSLVVFVDEIDAVRSLPFSADEFFAGIRESYNRRTQDAEFHRITYCLLGVATPADLITESRMSPFNIGRRIVVTDFTASEAEPLSQRLPGGALMLERVLYWTGGHPYLTQRMCKALSASDYLATGTATSDSNVVRIVDALCEELFLSKAARETDDNLAFVQNRLLKSEIDLAALLDVYREVASGKRVHDDETNSVIPVLRLSGVVRVEDGVLQVRNRIYAHVFNTEWVLSHMPHAELRRQRIAYQRGVVRAALVSAVVILIMAVLAGAAALNAHNANNLRHQANIARRESDMHARDAQRESRIAIAAQQAASANAQRASKSAQEAHQEAVRADAKEKEVEQANKTVVDLAQQRKVALDDRQSALISAIQARQKANNEAENANRLLYIANMNLAQQAYDNNNIARVLDLLKETASGVRHAFEWGYWQRECHLDLETLRWHRGRLTSVLYMSDGRRVVTGSLDGSVQVWDSLTGRHLGQLALQANSPVTSLSLSGDSSTLAVGAEDNTVQVYDAHTLRPTRLVETKGWPVDSVSLSHDGSKLIAAGGDHRSMALLTEWDVRTGNELHTVRVALPTFTCCAFSPDGRMAAASGPDRQIHIWDTVTWNESHRLAGHKSGVLCIAFSPDGKSLASGAYDNTVRIWDLESDQTVVTLTGHTQPVGSVAFSTDGAWVATAGYDNVARIWDATTGQTLIALKGHTDFVTAVAFSPDGTRLITGSNDGTARIWESTRRRDTLTLRGHTASVQDVAISPLGERIVSASADGTVRLWNGFSGRSNGLLQSSPPVIQTAVAYSQNGNYIACGSMDGALRIYEASDRRLLHSIQIGSSQIVSLAFSPDSRTICVASGAADTPHGARLCLVSAQDGDVTRVLQSDGPMPTCVAFNSTGTLIVSGSMDNMVHVWNAATGAPIRSWRATKPEVGPLQSFVTSACFSPDSANIAAAIGDRTGSGDNTARVFNARTGDLLLTLKGHANSLYSVAYSPDGNRIVTGSADKTARVWDTVTGREVLTLKGHENVVLKCLFTKDGNEIVTCGADGTIKVWERTPDFSMQEPHLGGFPARPGTTDRPSSFRPGLRTRQSP